jgi:hypothetical protein
MSESSATKTPPTSHRPVAETVDERRARAGFRALIDEMMMQIRAASRHAEWTPEARAQAEADLARIMARVRRAAVNSGTQSES